MQYNMIVYSGRFGLIVNKVFYFFVQPNAVAMATGPFCKALLSKVGILNKDLKKHGW